MSSPWKTPPRRSRRLPTKPLSAPSRLSSTPICEGRHQSCRTKIRYLDDRGQNLEGILTRRHSTRAFLPDSLPEDRITRLFELAQRTASWCNEQPWQVLV